MRMIYADELEDALTKAGIPIIVKGKATSAWGVPVVDAVEVVRCKDCIYRDHRICYAHSAEVYVREDDFCSRGSKGRQC